MKLSAYCMYCLVKRQEENIRKYTDEDKKAMYMKEVFKIIANAREDVTAPFVIADINQLHQQFFGKTYSFEELKYKYNQLMLEKEEAITTKIKNAPDPLNEALKYARIGNYIDFGAMGEIEPKKLEELLNTVSNEEINPTEYVMFQTDLQKARRLVYLTDNCGEVVLDKILIQLLKEMYPDLHITVIVRGGAVLNDATLEDAEMIGLSRLVDVIGNGTEMAGTQLECISPKARDTVNRADVIISKGQGNFETLHGCGLNIYYMFLCKCDWFVNRFQLERYKGVFLNEKNVI